MSTDDCRPQTYEEVVALIDGPEAEITRWRNAAHARAARAHMLAEQLQEANATIERLQKTVAAQAATITILQGGGPGGA